MTARRVMRGKAREARYAKHEWARVECRAYAAPSKCYRGGVLRERDVA